MTLPLLMTPDNLDNLPAISSTRLTDVIEGPTIKLVRFPIIYQKHTPSVDSLFVYEFKTTLEVSGPLDSNGYVVPCKAAKDKLERIMSNFTVEGIGGRIRLVLPMSTWYSNTNPPIDFLPRERFGYVESYDDYGAVYWCGRRYDRKNGSPADEQIGQLELPNNPAEKVAWEEIGKIETQEKGKQKSIPVYRSVIPLRFYEPVLVPLTKITDETLADYLLRMWISASGGCLSYSARRYQDYTFSLTLSYLDDPDYKVKATIKF